MTGNPSATGFVLRVAAAFYLAGDGVTNAVGGAADDGLEIVVVVFHFDGRAAAKLHEDGAVFGDAVLRHIDIDQRDRNVGDPVIELPQGEFESPRDVVSQGVAHMNVVPPDVPIPWQSPQKRLEG